MKVEVGTLVVLSSIYNGYVVMPHLYKVVSSTDKMITATPLNTDGSIINIEKIKNSRNTSIVAILDDIAEFDFYRKLNDEHYAKYTEFQNYSNSKFEQIAQIQKQTKTKFKKPT